MPFLRRSMKRKKDAISPTPWWTIANWRCIVHAVVSPLGTLEASPECPRGVELLKRSIHELEGVLWRYPIRHRRTGSDITVGSSGANVWLPLTNGAAPKNAKAWAVFQTFSTLIWLLQIPPQQATSLAGWLAVSGSSMGSRKVSREAVLGDVRSSPYRPDIKLAIQMEPGASHRLPTEPCFFSQGMPN
ncbi:hypothetical protein BJX63DRAFT_427240 [Aspergillus granulosus]|uniref:Uncharacterized protein n=1 Tax=Aspergillus granulosus TaxID=176169 RepID=A0ABR4I4U1_9EURO